jgi:hypothetical protein
MSKKYCFAICCCLFLFQFLHAQFRAGIKGGLNLNRPIGGAKKGLQQGYHIDKYDLHTNFHLGLTADIPVTKKFHIRPDLLVSRRVAQYEKIDQASGFSYYQRMAANYLEIPVHFVYYHPCRNFNLYLGGGPYLGFALSGKANNRGSRVLDSQQLFVYSNETDEWYKKTQFGAVLAAGIDLPFGLTWELSVHRGFNDISNSRLIENYSKVINFNYGFSVGYLFRDKVKAVSQSDQRNRTQQSYS